MSCKYTATLTQQNNYTATVEQQNWYTASVECDLDIVIGVWILTNGVWDDGAIWIDAETWNDS